MLVNIILAVKFMFAVHMSLLRLPLTSCIKALILDEFFVSDKFGVFLGKHFH